MGQDDINALKPLFYFLAVGVAFFTAVWHYAAADIRRRDEYLSCLRVGGTASDCSRIIDPSAWQEQHEQEERMREQLDALRRK